eukprot:jgi/Chlat1/1693/Chrsp127S01924
MGDSGEAGGGGASTSAAVRPRGAAKKKDEKKKEEDVCFVCKDGGSLVVCDDKNCPKAYHPPCIARDAAYFADKARWVCGWHYCAECSRSIGRTGGVRCLTCPSASCRDHVESSQHVLLLPNAKPAALGLCGDCHPLVRLVEGRSVDVGVGGDGGVDGGVDSDEVSFLKWYWENTVKPGFGVEYPMDSDPPLAGSVLQPNNKKGRKRVLDSPASGNGNVAKSARKSTHESLKAAAGGLVDLTAEGEAELVGDDALVDDVVGEERQQEGEEGSELTQSDEEQEEEAVDTPRGGSAPRTPTPVPVVPPFSGWGSPPLLELLKKINVDTRYPIRLFTLVKHLWTYIKAHDLQDPSDRRRILCDDALQAIFHSPSIGHSFEFSRLLRPHLAFKKQMLGTQKSTHTPLGRRNSGPLAGSNQDNGKSLWAAINPRNINLLYLRRSVLEDALADRHTEPLFDRSFVRIMIPMKPGEQMQMYRLVPVVGVTELGDPYPIYLSRPDLNLSTRKRLEVQNLKGKEDVCITNVSNADFTPDECRRLRELVRLGHVLPSAPTVREMEARANACAVLKRREELAKERRKQLNLRDRASEQGAKKALREADEALRRLSDPAQIKQLLALPPIEDDPLMAPDAPESPPPPEEERRPRSPDLAPSFQYSSFLIPSAGDRMATPVTPEKPAASPTWNNNNTNKPAEGPAVPAAKSGWGALGGVNNNHNNNVDNNNVPPANSNDKPVERRPSWGSAGTGNAWGANRTDSPSTSYRRNEETQGGGNNRGWGSGARQFEGNGRRRDGASPSRREDTYTRDARHNNNKSWGGSDLPTRDYNRDTRYNNDNQAGSSRDSYETKNTSALFSARGWHYYDPTGKEHGPFGVDKLLSWRAKLPADLRVWADGRNNSDAVLLSDVLDHYTRTELSQPQSVLPPLSTSSYAQGRDVGLYRDRDTEWDVGRSHRERDMFGDRDSNRKRKPCRFFPQGNCRKGDSCTFLHER